MAFNGGSDPHNCQHNVDNSSCQGQIWSSTSSVGLQNQHARVQSSSDPQKLSLQTVCPTRVFAEDLPSEEFDEWMQNDFRAIDLPLNSAVQDVVPYGNGLGASVHKPHHFDPSGRPPFEDMTRNRSPIPYGVIRIKNIPYALTQSEVIQFMHKHAGPNDLLQPHLHGYPVHIIMERSTAKTMDCFVELLTHQAAEAAIHRHESLMQSSKPPKMGTRHVVMELSNQGELMREMFPRAKSVRWNAVTGLPCLYENRDPYSEGFRGFFTTEELAGMLRHAEFPQRSPFSGRCLQRTYEAMISTLYKFPWSSSYYYTIATRNRLFDIYLKQLNILVSKITSVRREVGLDTKLLMDLVFAGMNCPGFSESQKCLIVVTAGTYGRGIQISSFSPTWPFETLSKATASSDHETGLWLHLLNLGLEYCEATGQELCVGSWIQVGRDQTGAIRFHTNDNGGDLSFADYSHFEQDLLRKLIEMGWNQYFAQSGSSYRPRSMEVYDADLHRRLNILRRGEVEARRALDSYQPLPDIDQASEAMDDHYNAFMPQPVRSKRYAGILSTNLNVTEVPSANNLAEPLHKEVLTIENRPTSGLGSGLAIRNGHKRANTVAGPISCAVQHFNPEIPSFHPNETNSAHGSMIPRLSSPFAPRRRGNSAISIRTPQGTPINIKELTTQAHGRTSSRSESSPEKRLRNVENVISTSPTIQDMTNTLPYISTARHTSPGTTRAYGSPSGKGSSPMKSTTRRPSIGFRAKSTLDIDSTITEEEGENDANMLNNGD